MSVSPFDIPRRRKENGEPCCEFFDAAGPRLTLACEPCQRHYLHEEALRQDAAPPNGYKVGLAALRAATATPARDFEDRYKAARLRDLEAEATRRAGAAEAPAPRMTSAELAPYAAPDSYEAGLKALRAKETR